MVLPIKQLDNLLDFIEFQSIRHEEEAEVEYLTHQEYATPPVAQFNASLCWLIERDETVFRPSDYRALFLFFAGESNRPQGVKMMDRLPSLGLPGLSLSSHSLGQQASSLNNHHHHSGHSSLNSLGLHTPSALHNSASTSVAAAAAAAASLYTTAQNGHHHIMNNSNNTR